MKKDTSHKAARGAIDWSARLPDLSDDGIANLLRNAQRLRASADESQAEAAAELVPAIEEEMVARRARRAAASATKAAAKKNSTAQAPVAKPPATKMPTRVRTAPSKRAADA